jgi:hypothetical protein
MLKKRSKVLSLLVLTTLVASTGRVDAGQNEGPHTADDIRPYSLIAPPSISPARESYVVREGDQFIAILTATCYLEDQSDTQFELSASSPAFVHVSSGYRSEKVTNGYIEGLGVLYVTPQTGDAGKYVVSVIVKACNGNVERVITFKLRVKPFSN